ncbi:hypothetical protein SK128_018091, partial [Halocaridina rubra]
LSKRNTVMAEPHKTGEVLKRGCPSLGISTANAEDMPFDDNKRAYQGECAFGSDPITSTNSLPHDTSFSSTNSWLYTSFSSSSSSYPSSPPKLSSPPPPLTKDFMFMNSLVTHSLYLMPLDEPANLDKSFSEIMRARPMASVIFAPLERSYQGADTSDSLPRALYYKKSVWKPKDINFPERSQHLREQRRKDLPNSQAINIEDHRLKDLQKLKSNEETHIKVKSMKKNKCSQQDVHCFETSPSKSGSKLFGKASHFGKLKNVKVKSISSDKGSNKKVGDMDHKTKTKRSSQKLVIVKDQRETKGADCNSTKEGGISRSINTQDDITGKSSRRWNLAKKQIRQKPKGKDKLITQECTEIIKGMVHCPLCLGLFMSASHLNKHMSKEHYKSLFSCKTCRKTFKLSRDLTKHEKLCRQLKSKDANPKTRSFPKSSTTRKFSLQRESTPSVTTLSSSSLAITRQPRERKLDILTESSSSE